MGKHVEATMRAVRIGVYVGDGLCVYVSEFDVASGKRFVGPRIRGQCAKSAVFPKEKRETPAASSGAQDHLVTHRAASCRDFLGRSAPRSAHAADSCQFHSGGDVRASLGGDVWECSPERQTAWAASEALGDVVRGFLAIGR